MTQQNYKITLEEFTVPEKSALFGMPNLTVNENSYTHTNSYNLLSRRPEYAKYIMGNYKFITEVTGEDYEELQKLQDKLDFSYKVIFGCYFPIRIFTGSCILAECIQNFNSHIASYRKEKFDRKSLDRLIKLFSQMNDEKNGDLSMKITILKELLDISMSRNNYSMQGAYYITLIESLLVPDKGTEVAYRFALRYAKLTDSGLNGLKKAKQYYSKRSDAFHSGKGNFSVEEVLELETIACKFIEDYFQNPNDFSA